MVRFSENFMWYGKEFQSFGPRSISNFLFQILLDLSLEFLDTVYISLVLNDPSFSA